MPWPARLLMILAGTFLWLGLAVLGWGGFAAFFAHTAFRALAGVFLVVAVAAVFAGGNVSSGVKEDRGNRWVLWAFTILGLLLGYLPAWSDRAGFWVIDGATTRWIGVVLVTLGCALRLWPVYVLGDRFSGLVAIQPDHTLETGGVYRYVRNPSYLGMLVMVVGWALTFRSVVGLLIAALMLPPLVARMHAEEALLRARFGAEYDAYLARTWRLIPGVY